MIDIIQRQIDKALSRVRLAFRGVLLRVNSASAVQLAQLHGLAGEQLQDNELMQHYGFTSHPPIGTMGVVLPIGGKTAHGIVIATEHGNFRLQGLAEGEVALYSSEGDSIVFKRGRKIEITTGLLVINAESRMEIHTPEVWIGAPQVTTTGDLDAAGDITDLVGAGGSSMAHFREVYDEHVHPENDHGGPTNRPNQQV